MDYLALRSKYKWFQKICKEHDALGLKLKEKLRVTLRDWLFFSTSINLLLTIAALPASLTMYYFVSTLSCRATNSKLTACF